MQEPLVSKNHFQHAHSKALRQDLLAKVGGRDNDLLPYDTLAEILKLRSQITHPQVQMIPLNKIVGSVGRYRDFNRSFLPRNPSMADRWARIEAAMEGMQGLPPIDVYKVGEVYFVIDGNHRVSVARANNFEEIAARVIEIPVDVGLEPGDSLDRAIVKVGRARFLAQTGLQRHYPNPDIYLTVPGGYQLLLEHIKVHQRFMQDSEAGTKTVSLEEAAVDWYRFTYLPIVEAIRKRSLLDNFPNRTAADLYVWVWKTVIEMYRISGETVSPEEATELVALQGEPMSFQEEIQALMSRIISLVPAATDIPDWVSQEFQWGDAPIAPSWREAQGE